MTEKPKLVTPPLKSSFAREEPRRSADLPPALTDPGKPNRRAMHLRLPIDLWWRLSQYAMRADRPRVDVVLQAVVAFLDSEGA